MTKFVRVAHGIWRPADATGDRWQQAAAFFTATPGYPVFSDWTSAELHGLWLPPLAPGRITFIRHFDTEEPRRHSGSRREQVRARRRPLCPDEVTQLGGLPVTTMARTWIDLAEFLSPPDLLAVGDSALRFGECPEAMATAVKRAVHRRGVVRARAILPMLDGRSASRPESHLRYALITSGLPTPEVNVPIYSSTGEWLAEPDLSYDDARLALEYNGAVHASVDRMRRDITREFDVSSRGGWRLVTVGPAQVFKRPDETAAWIRTLRRERLPGRT